ncbi:hypothetical protein ACFQO1_12445 [Jejudonia soesokkakensis]|uniref:Uncharacterized protein n=1 Tax=Jejudonia soesokkakensis TaxID=1323432 RepID=A0ABW2MY75_9FLAO
MKNTLTKLVFLLVSVLVLFSCQKEESEMIDETDEETITANSTLANLLSRSSQNPGDLDDIIDGSDCVQVVLPITVFANGQKVIITDEDDIEIVEDIFDQFPNDQDTLEIVFPINIVLADFTQVTVTSQTELDAIIAACENDLDDTLECVSFVYPLTFFTYDSNQQQTGTVIINSDVEMFLFLSNLDDDDIIALQYPVSVIVNGETTVIANNTELVTLLSETNCDNSSIPVDELEAFITSGSWYITYFFDDLDETDDFDGYEFTFATNNTAAATNGSNTVTGTWELTGSSTPDFELFFGTQDPFDELDEDWDILEINENIIRLRDISGGDGSTDYLTFEREPNTNTGGGDVNALIQVLISNNWYVTTYDDDGDDETCDYVDYEFTYTSNGSVTAVSSANTVTGNWAVQNSGSGLDLVLNFNHMGDDDPFEDLNDDWDVVEFDAQVVRLIDISGGNGGTDNLVFGRTPPTNCGTGGNTAAFIENLITDNWFITLYEEDEGNEACNYVDYTFEFFTNGTSTATSDTNTVNGTWSAQNSGSGIDLTLMYEFTGTNDPFEELNDDWDVIEFDGQIIRLVDVSGGGGGTDFLNFERNPLNDCTGNNATELTNILLEGEWFVALYDEDGDDQTSTYQDFNFSFNVNDEVIANGNGTTVNGTWMVLGGTTLDMALDFGPMAPLEEFNDDDWDVISYTSTRVELRDVSGGGGGTDTLVFEKL